MQTEEAAFLFRFFDPQEDRLIIERRLPHWSQAGTTSFLTWRCWDSLPKDVLDAWYAERRAWLARRGIDVTADDWRDRLAQLPLPEQHDYHNQVSARWEASLDEGHGACVLRRPELAKTVADSLHHFDEDRYLLTDFVIMPNHAHVLAVFQDPEQMLRQCDSWKHFTATKINKALGRRGHFWQVDGFDHLVRSSEQFEYLCRYIADNPRRARLQPGEYVHYSRGLGDMNKP